MPQQIEHSNWNAAIDNRDSGLTQARSVHTFLPGARECRDGMPGVEARECVDELMGVFTRARALTEGRPIIKENTHG